MAKIISRFLVVTITSLVLVLASGCVSSRETAYGTEEVNFFGIYKKETASFESKGPASFEANASDYTARKNFSGNSYSVLWGLITWNDF